MVQNAFSLLLNIPIVRTNVILGSKVKLNTWHFLISHRLVFVLTTKTFTKLVKFAWVFLLPLAVISGLTLSLVSIFNLIALVLFYWGQRIVIAGEIISLKDYTLTWVLLTCLTMAFIRVSLTPVLALRPWLSIFGRRHCHGSLQFNVWWDFSFPFMFWRLIFYLLNRKIVCLIDFFPLFLRGLCFGNYYLFMFRQLFAWLLYRFDVVWLFNGCSTQLSILTTGCFMDFHWIFSLYTDILTVFFTWIRTPTFILRQIWW